MGDDSGRDLHLPADGEPSAAAVVLHPHPGMGGDRHHPLVVALAEGLSAAGVAALRLDLRDPSVPGASQALAAEAGALREEVGVDRLLLVGYSWGAAVVARTSAAGTLGAGPRGPAGHDAGPPAATGACPRARAGARPVRPAGRGRPRHSVGWPDATVEVVDGCDHFLAGAIGRITDRAVDWVTA